MLPLLTILGISTWGVRQVALANSAIGITQCDHQGEVRSYFFSVSAISLTRTMTERADDGN